MFWSLATVNSPRELGDVIAIVVEISGKLERVPHLPAFAPKHLPIRLFALAQRQFETLVDAAG